MVNVTFRRIEPSDALQDYAIEKVEKAAKFLYKEFHGEVVLYTEKYWQCAEIKVTGEGRTSVGSARTEDMYAAIDGAMAKVSKQLRKAKDRTHVPDRKTGEHEAGAVAAAAEPKAAPETEA